jgi:hypothetical protein
MTTSSNENSRGPIAALAGLRYVVYGLDGLDDLATQTTAGLLAMPFRDPEASGSPELAARHASR